MEIAAGEYGYEPAYFRRMLDAGAVDVLQADVTRCGGHHRPARGRPRSATRTSVPLSAHCAPAAARARRAARSAPLRHLEYFHDHARIEQMLFDGVLEPRTARCARTADRPGLGIELEARDAERFAA